MAAGFLIFPLFLLGGLLIVAVKLLHWTATYGVPVLGTAYLLFRWLT